MNRIISTVAISAGALLVCASTALADHVTRVNVMPDRQVRPGVALPVFGSEDGGTGALGHNGLSTYAWTFTFNAAAVSVASATPGPAIVGNDRYIVTNTTFTLIGGATRQTVVATLTVTASDISTASKSVNIDVVSTADPISNTALNSLQVDVNIAIEDGLRAMYLAQNTATGGWFGNTACGTTGFSVWAFSNSGHRPTAVTHPSVDLSRDIYAEWVQKGINYILNSNSSIINSAALKAHLGNPYPGTPGTPDSDADGSLVNLCPGGQEGYQNGISEAAIEAAYSAFPADMHGGGPAGTNFALPGPFTGVNASSYFQIIQDAIDWTAFAQNDGAGGVGRGGWYYTACGTAASCGDTSVEGWEYVGQEGFEEVFGGTVLENVKREVEIRLDWSQSQIGTATSYGQFSYGNAEGAAHVGHFSGTGNATTGAGLSGLNLVTRSGRTAWYLDSAGGSGGTLVGPFASPAGRKAAAVANLGFHWNDPPGQWIGNLGNFYAMWTQARALRLNGTTQLVNSAHTFDWQTGEDPTAPGVVPGPGPREGYFKWLVDNQNANGSWPAFLGTYSIDINTAFGVLILQPRVFPSAGDCSTAVPSLTSLAYPLDHTLRPITISGVGGAKTVITGICQDENPNFENIPAYAQDGFITTTTNANDTAMIRAEFSGTRAHPSNGRVYSIQFNAPDLFCSGIVTVNMNTTPGGVPVAVNDGRNWNSVTQANSCPF